MTDVPQLVLRVGPQAIHLTPCLGSAEPPELAHCDRLFIVHCGMMSYGVVDLGYPTYAHF